MAICDYRSISIDFCTLMVGNLRALIHDFVEFLHNNEYKINFNHIVYLLIGNYIRALSYFSHGLSKIQTWSPQKERRAKEAT